MPFATLLLLFSGAVARAQDVCDPPKIRTCDELDQVVEDCRTTAEVSEHHLAGNATLPGGPEVGVSGGRTNSSEQVACTMDRVDLFQNLALACRDAAEGQMGADDYWRSRRAITGADYLKQCRIDRLNQGCAKKEAFNGMSCVPMFDADWILTVEAANIVNTKRPDGTSWDADSSTPADLFVQVSLAQASCSDSTALTVRCNTPIKQDNWQPVWNYSCPVMRLRPDSHLCFTLFDADVFSNERVAVLEMPTTVLATALQDRHLTLRDSTGSTVDMSFSPTR
jgi:hypothetical protein